MPASWKSPGCCRHSWSLHTARAGRSQGHLSPLWQPSRHAGVGDDLPFTRPPRRVLNVTPDTPSLVTASCIEAVSGNRFNICSRKAALRR